MPRAWSYFNPRTPCGVRPGRTARKGETPYFNPRTPCGVRLGVGHILYGLLHFNPRTPCGVRRRGCRSRRARRIFQSTHPVRGATVCAAVTCGFEEFQSTHPVRGATCRRHGGGRGAEISIHAPRAGCDTRCAWSARQSSNFNPRTPCGVRLGVQPLTSASSSISIHAPRAGCDHGKRPHARGAQGFQSTHPVRGATAKERRKFIGLLSLFHKTSLPSGILAPNPHTASRTERHFSVRSTRGIHVHFGFAPQIMSTPSGS